MSSDISSLKALPKVLLLSTTEQGHARRSGYSILAEYMTSAEHVSYARCEPKGVVQRGLLAIISRCAMTRWYRLSSARAEWRAWQRCRFYNGVVHMMWADRDWGVFDFMCKPGQATGNVTFHGCPDTLS